MDRCCQTSLRAGGPPGPGGPSAAEEGLGKHLSDFDFPRRARGVRASSREGRGEALLAFQCLASRCSRHCNAKPSLAKRLSATGECRRRRATPPRAGLHIAAATLRRPARPAAADKIRSNKARPWQGPPTHWKTSTTRAGSKGIDSKSPRKGGRGGSSLTKAASYL